MNEKGAFERILAGESASIENTDSNAISISLTSDNGCRLEIELHPGQVVGFSSGRDNADVTLHKGDPKHLLVIKPGSAS